MNQMAIWDPLKSVYRANGAVRNGSDGPYDLIFVSYLRFHQKNGQNWHDIPPLKSHCEGKDTLDNNFIVWRFF